jgi:hypothetical protein
VSRLPYYKWFPDDYAGSVRGWSLLERGGYREALDAQWSQDGLPVNPDEIRRSIWARIESKFPIAPDGHRRNPRLEQERQRVSRVSVVRSELGRLGAAKRYSNSHGNSDSNSQSFAMPSRSRTRTPDSGDATARMRAGPASPEGPPARPSGAIDENDPEVRRQRQRAAELAAALTEGNKG